MANNNFLTIPRNYQSHKTLKKTQLDESLLSVETGINDIIDDINQLRLDIFGTDFIFNQNGLSSQAAPIRDATTTISSLNWKFTGSITLPSSITIDQVGGDYTLAFSNPSVNRTITFGDPGANDSVAYLDAIQTISNKTLLNCTFGALTYQSPLSINEATGTNCILNFQLDTNTKWSQFLETGTNDLKISNASGSYSVSVSQSAKFTINSETDGDPSYYYKENGVTKWYSYNDHTTDSLLFKDLNGNQRFSLMQDGTIGLANSWRISSLSNTISLWNPVDTTTPRLYLNALNVIKTLEVNCPTVIADYDVGFKVLSGVDKNSYVMFSERTLVPPYWELKWSIYNDHTTDDLFITNNAGSGKIRLDASEVDIHYLGSPSAVAKFSTSGLFVEHVDPPQQPNYFSSLGAVKFYVYYIDNSGAWSNSFNIDSITDDDGDGVYNVNFDRDFGAGELPVTVATVSGITGYVATVYTPSTSSVLVRITNGGVLTDATFTAIGMGVQ